MTSLIWYIILVKMVLCSESDSSSSSSESNEYGAFFALFDGQYSANGVGFSICTAKNGNIYGAAGPMGQNYINTYGRSTEGVLQVSDGIYQATFDVVQLKTGGSNGVNILTSTLTYYESTDTTTVSFGEDPASALNKTADTGEICVIPDANWNDVVEDVPLYLKADICPDFDINCVTIYVLMDSGGCWARYDTDNDVFLNSQGGAYINRQIMWEGELLISEWINVDGATVCPGGTSLSVWINEEEEQLSSSKCIDFDGFGEILIISTDADVLDEVEGATCPLYVDSSANAMFRNDDEYNENGNKVETIVIDFSNTSIGILWAILIVFICVTIGMCWCFNRKKK
eukprot:426331_1